MFPQISIIIPVYNKEVCISKTLESVLSQKYSNFEIIIVDDGSTDKSAAVIKSITDSRLRYIYKENGGPSSARNFGVKNSKGEWILFLDADDMLCPDALEHFYNLVNKYHGIKCFCTNHYSLCNGKKKIYSHIYKSGIVKNPFKSWLYKSFMPRAGAALFHKDIVFKYEHKSNLRRYEDADFLFNIMRNEKFVSSKKPVMIYNHDSLSASKARNDIKEDFLAYLSIEGKEHWEKVVLLDLFFQCKMLYPSECKRIYDESNFCQQDIMKDYLLSKRVVRIKNLFNKILNCLHLNIII